MAGVLELRVHGVSGTPPAEVLGVADGRVTPAEGDTSFHRAVDPSATSGPPLPADAQREAYSWGALTSSAAGVLGWLQRALWLTLLPFALVNVAMWARPGQCERSRSTTVGAGLVRAAGLLLTALLVVAACGVGVDLVAWQCFREGVPRCPVLPGWLDPLAAAPLEAPARRLAVGQVLPVAALGVLWWLARVTIQRYEAYPSRPAGVVASAAGPARTREALRGHVLGSPRMWRGEPRTRALARLHLAAGACTVVAYTGAAVAGLPGSRPAEVTGWAAVALGAAVLLATARGGRDAVERLTAPPAARASAADPGGPAPADRTAALLLAPAALLLVVHTALLLADGRDAAEPAQPPGAGAAPGVLVLVLFVLVGALVGVSRAAWTALLGLVPVAAALVVVAATDPGAESRFWTLAGVLAAVLTAGVLLHRRTCREPQMWGGAAPAVLVGAAVLVAVLFSTSLTLLTATWLNGGRSVSSLGAASPAERDGDLRVGADATLVGGWLDVTGTAVTVRGGRLESAELAVADGGLVTVVPSRPLDGDPVRTEGELALSGVCVTGVGGADGSRRSGTLVLAEAGAVATITAGADPSGTPPPDCRGGAAGVDAVNPAGAGHLAVPALHVWVATVLPPLLAAAVLVVAVLHATLARALRPPAGADRRSRPADRARRRAAYAHRAEAVLGALSAPVVAAAVVVAAGAGSGLAPEEVLGGSRWQEVTDAGLWAAAGVGALIVGVGARMRSSATLRRSVGVLWDLSTFWPRAAHPFGPPCYAERVVPEVTARVTAALAAGQHVVVSGHSQGSTIAVAALCQVGAHPDVDDDAWARVRFVSYGSQLRAWFGRLFPDTLGPDVLGHAPTRRTGFRRVVPDVPPGGRVHRPPAGTLAAALDVGERAPRWRNLYRRTDPLGFPVHQDGEPDAPPGAVPVDLCVPDGEPVTDPYTLQAVHTHSRYPAARQYADVVGGWFRELSPPPPLPPPRPGTPPAGQPAQPGPVAPAPGR